MYAAETVVMCRRCGKPIEGDLILDIDYSGTTGMHEHCAPEVETPVDVEADIERF